jgi:GntR family transcriptional regulator, transcriptional repressor for pyruvate dehydrogenase complex
MGDRFILAPVRVPPAYEKLAGMIRDRVISADLRPGDRIPSEARLADEAGVSRSTVREALRMLQEEGFVERSSPKIMVVRRDAGEPQHRELLHALRRRNVTFRQLHEALMVIEPELSGLAATRADAKGIDDLRRNLGEQRDSLNSFPTWCRLDEEFHLIIGRLSGNPAMLTARAPITQLLLPTLNQFIDSEEMTAAASDFHARILDAIAERDAESAALMTRRHIDDFGSAWEAAGLDFRLQIGALTNKETPT